MFITIINDCRDENTMARQATRANALFDQYVATLGVSQSDMEAAGNLIDILDASDDKKGIIMVNVAPRHGKAKKWPNGTPFGYFYHGETLIVATVDGYCLSLAKKMKLADKFYVTDVALVIDEMIKQGKIKSELRNLIVNSQFRSFDYMPRLAKWLHDGIEVPHEELPLDQIADIPHAVWWVDNFGNCKTTILPEEIGFEPGKVIKSEIGDLTCYFRLKDVPNDEPGLIIGSSGYGSQRFLEVVVQGKSAAERFGIKTGMNLL
jgi:hypothetical protein